MILVYPLLPKGLNYSKLHGCIILVYWFKNKNKINCPTLLLTRHWKQTKRSTGQVVLCTFYFKGWLAHEGLRLIDSSSLSDAAHLLSRNTQAPQHFLPSTSRAIWSHRDNIGECGRPAISSSKKGALSLSYKYADNEHTWELYTRRSGAFGEYTSVADPWHFGVDPDPDPALSVIDFQEVNKKLIFYKSFFFLLLFEDIVTSFFNDKK
jgi:hypothetical protein